MEKMKNIWFYRCKFARLTEVTDRPIAKKAESVASAMLRGSTRYRKLQLEGKVSRPQIASIRAPELLTIT